MSTLRGRLGRLEYAARKTDVPLVPPILIFHPDDWPASDCHAFDRAGEA